MPSPTYHPCKLWFTVIAWHAVLYQVVMKRGMHFSIYIISVETSLLRGKLDNTFAASTIDLTAPLKCHHLLYLQSTVQKYSNAIIIRVFPTTTTTTPSSNYPWQSPALILVIHCSQASPMVKLMAHHLVYGLVSGGWEEMRDTAIGIASKLSRRQYSRQSEKNYS